MKNRLIFGFILIGTLLYLNLSNATAQEEAPPKPWTHSLDGSVNLSQIGVKDWAQGDDSALSWTFDIEGESVYDRRRIDWEADYSFTFGQSKINDEPIRKTDDKIDLETLFTYKPTPKIGPYVSATLKTQFATGFRFEDDGSKTPRSKFLDPGYLTQGTGVIYKPTKQVRIRLGVALREVVTDEFRGFADNPETTKKEKNSVSGGLESVIRVKWKLRKNLSFRTRLEVFSAFRHFTDAVVRSDSVVTFKFGEYLNVKFRTQLVNDTTASPDVQIKETLTFGVNYSFF